jgi:hypothetical protein
MANGGGVNPERSEDCTPFTGKDDPEGVPAPPPSPSWECPNCGWRTTLCLPHLTDTQLWDELGSSVGKHIAASRHGN